MDKELKGLLDEIIKLQDFIMEALKGVMLEQVTQAEQIKKLSERT